MLSIQHITKRYPGAGEGRPAVDDLSLEVSHGEILALVGESGSGKTTLLRLIAGFEYADLGQICINGSCVSDAENACRVPPEKRRIGYVFQEGALFPHRTVEQNVAYGLPRGAGDRNREIVSGLLKTVGLANMGKRYPHQLSGGEAQRVALARALAPRPALVLLDEPFSNLDPSLRRDLRDEVRAILTNVQATALLVTHDTADALAVGNRVAVIKDGRLEQLGTPSEVYHAPASEYAAGLFGPVNRFFLPNSKSEWCRPEELSLYTESKGEHCIKVTVIRICKTGRDTEVTVKWEDAESGEEGMWLIYDDADWITPGIEAWVERREC